MEFHDILHGRIQFMEGDPLTLMLFELINSPEIHRLRNMRQMNFDVPLIQELGRSRRLPHSIGVANLAYSLAKKCLLNDHDSKALLAAAILHDAAIPPYGHLVESEFKSVAPDFKHEKRVEGLIRGTISPQNKYQDIVPGKSLQVSAILNRHHVDISKVFEIICPADGKKSPISADIDLDNIDNVHRMAAMLGWPGARENFNDIVSYLSLKGLEALSFSRNSIPSIERWLDFRQKIYTMIIAHPECVPYNALQADMVRQSVSEKIISPDDWWLSEPEYEEKLRSKEHGTRALAVQLISGCNYQLIDYVWIKNYQSTTKKHNAEIVKHLLENLPVQADQGYFVWNEKKLISRRIKISGDGWQGEYLGADSTSCMIALVKKTIGKPKWTKPQSLKWRRDAMTEFTRIFDSHEFEADFPETYTGDFLAHKNNEIRISYP